MFHCKFLQMMSKLTFLLGICYTTLCFNIIFCDLFLSIILGKGHIIQRFNGRTSYFIYFLRTCLLSKTQTYGFRQNARSFKRTYGCSYKTTYRGQSTGWWSSTRGNGTRLFNWSWSKVKYLQHNAKFTNVQICGLV